MSQKKKKKIGAWIELIDRSIGKFVHFETAEGLHREGKLTGLRKREILVNGESVYTTIAIELNGDPNDYVELLTIISIDID